MTETISKVIPLEARHGQFEYIKGHKIEKKKTGIVFPYITKDNMLKVTVNEDEASYYGGGKYMKTDMCKEYKGRLVIDNEVTEIFGVFEDEHGTGVLLRNKEKHYVTQQGNTIIDYTKNSDNYTIAYFMYKAIEKAGERVYSK